MTKEEMQSLVAQLVDELREMPDHTELTTWQVIKAAGYADNDYSTIDLMNIDYELRRAARKAHITLDGSKHDGKVILPFVVLAELLKKY